MKKSLLLVAASLLCAAMSAQGVATFVEKQLATYPKSRLIDIYKSCFQDFMGSEHLVADTAAARRYLEAELAATDTACAPQRLFEPCGPQGRFFRISLLAVKKGLVSECELLDAFVRSSNAQRPRVDLWRKEWRAAVDTIARMGLGLPRFAQDSLRIDSLLAAGQYAVSHSPEYRAAYAPHYRIVSREVFEAEFSRRLSLFLKDRGQ